MVTSKAKNTYLALILNIQSRVLNTSQVLPYLILSTALCRISLVFPFYISHFIGKKKPKQNFQRHTCDTGEKQEWAPRNSISLLDLGQLACPFLLLSDALVLSSTHLPLGVHLPFMFLFQLHTLIISLSCVVFVVVLCVVL